MQAIADAVSRRLVFDQYRHVDITIRSVIAASDTPIQPGSQHVPSLSERCTQDLEKPVPFGAFVAERGLQIRNLRVFSGAEHAATTGAKNLHGALGYKVVENLQHPWQSHCCRSYELSGALRRLVFQQCAQNAQVAAVTKETGEWKSAVALN